MSRQLWDLTGHVMDLRTNILNLEEMWAAGRALQKTCDRSNVVKINQSSLPRMGSMEYKKQRTI
ncbi:hypothetical protein QJS04_geneDACA016636 [Acorus gramineus]|uniref:Uncharacterized protein n=1 Tax=Acorus gramineus TaxID=55184 RepID=A0AAV9BR84_ACOGR|nr:hypothetical protein QJS04_geneDACA016636 [Acorus gramineus]